MQRIAKTFFTIFIITSFVLSSFYYFLSSPSTGASYNGLSFRQAQDGSVLLNTKHGPVSVWRLPESVAYLHDPARQAVLSSAQSITLSRPRETDGFANTLIYLMKQGLEGMGKTVITGFTNTPPYANCTTQSTPTIILQYAENDTIINTTPTCFTILYTSNQSLADMTGVLFYEALNAYR